MHLISYSLRLPLPGDFGRSPSTLHNAVRLWGKPLQSRSQTSLVSVQAGAPVYLRHYLEEKEEKGSELFILETGPEK